MNEDVFCELLKFAACIFGENAIPVSFTGAQM
jgi:hypothetical protein